MKVGSNINAERSNWSFGGKTAESFVEHAELSIPFYHVGHDLISNDLQNSNMNSTFIVLFNNL